MKGYFKIFVLIAGIMLILSLVSVSISAKEENNAKEPLDKLTFIHYKDGTVKAVGGNSRAPVCYKLLGMKWVSLPVTYVINPAYSGMSNDEIVNAITASTAEWDEHTSRSLFGSHAIDLSATWDDGTINPVDYQNEYVFGVYPDSNVIAVTNIWYTRYRKQIVDYDVLFNTLYSWGDATSNPGSMDLQNIATHETGHGLGLADLYTSSCLAVTMYGYSSYGETSKRSLEQPDITGLQKMYGF